MKDVINLRLFAVLLGMTVMIMSLFGSVRLHFTYSAFERSLDAQVNVTAERISDAVKPAIWTIYSKSHERTFSQEFASAVLDSELKSDYVEGIIVYGRFGHIYMGRYKGNDGLLSVIDIESSMHLEKRSNLVKEYPIKFDDMTLGKVELYINTSILEEEQRDAVVYELIQIASIAVLFVALVFVAIKTSLRSPMSKLQIARKTFENMGEAIAFTDSKGKIHDTNPAFRSLTRIGTEESDLYITEFFPKILGDVLSKGPEMVSWEGETSCVLASGRKLPVWLTVTSVATSKSKAPSDLDLVFLFQDISSRKAAEEKLEQFAFYDSLTGLANRQYFEMQLEQFIHDAHRNCEKVALVYIDLDNFKHVNDTIGHSSGDVVLVEISKRLKARVRETDFLARLGGDEFVAVVRDVQDTKSLSTVAENLNALATKPVHVQDIDFVLGASIGISVYPDDALSASDLLKHADVAMYEAKGKGKNRHAFYSSSLQRKADRFFELKRKMDVAIANQQFKLFYQPKVNLVTKKIESAEALIRWIDADGSIIPPDQFIPLSEETRQIIPIGYWVIDTAVEQIAKWSDTRFSDISVSINLSQIQLYDEGLVGYIQSAIEKHEVDPGKIEFEVTESAVLDDLQQGVSLLNKIKQLGIRISLDDFGTGYSSLSYIRELPIDILKIDRAFINDAREGNTSGSILDLIIRLADVLALDVVAEGVENQCQVEFLVAHNCQLGQGYYFSPPVPPKEFEQLEYRSPLNVVDLRKGARKE